MVGGARELRAWYAGIQGLAGAYGLSLILRNRLFGVGPQDVESYLLAAPLLSAAAALACWVLTASAVRVDPIATLKE